MKTGKLDPEFLKNNIFPYLGKKRSEVILRAQIGEDSAVLDFKDNLAVFSVDPITGAGENIGYLAVNVSLNDIVTNGATPISLMFSVLLPENIKEEEIISLIKEMHDAAVSLDVEIVGGHTEITPGLSMPIITAFAIGKVEKDKLLKSSSSQPDDAIIITKGAGIEGTAILASTFSEELQTVFGSEFVERAKSYINKVSVLKEASLVRDYVNAMHDATEGGVYGGIYELSLASGLGFVIYEDKIPILEETRKLVQYFNLNPYFLISSGTLIITTNKKEEVLKILRENGIEGALIGYMKKEKKMQIKKKDGVYPFKPQIRDELWRLLERG